MLSSKEIIEKKFDKIGKGYKTDEVDAFLKEVSIAYESLNKDFNENEKKIIKLVDKINEYREEEDAIKYAILGAQKQAKQVIFEAEIEAQRRISDASSKAEQLIIATKDQYAEELIKLENLKKEVSMFKSQLTDLYNKQLRLIMEIPEIEDDDCEESENSSASAEQVSENFQEYSQNLDSNNNFQNLRDTYHPNQSRFGDLKFGHNQNK